MTTSSNRWAPALAICACWIALATTTVAQDIDIPLRVVEHASIQRVGELVTVGIPLGIDRNIRVADRLGVFDDQNTEIPAQFKVLARWHGPANDPTRAIKWLLITFPASVDPTSVRTYRLKRGLGVAPAAPVAVTDVAGQVAVDTGPLRFTISKTSANLFDTVFINQRQIVTPSLSNGFVLRDHTGRTFSSAKKAPESVIVEESGPLRAVIRLEGMHSDGQNDLLRYIIRIHAYAGKPFVRVFYALRNSKSYGYATPAGHAYLMDAKMQLECDLGAQLEATFRDESYALATGDRRELQQDMAGADDSSKVKDTNLNLHDNFIRRIVDQFGTTLATQGGKDDGNETGRDPGFMDLGSNAAGVTIGMRDFWQNFPKTIGAQGDGAVWMGLLPEFGYYVDEGYYQRTPPPSGAEDDYTFGGGRQKTHEIYVHFRTTSVAQARVRNAVAAFNDPLIATADPSLYAESAAIQLMTGKRDWKQHASFSPQVRVDMDRFERFQEGKWNPLAVDVQRSLGRVTYKAFRKRGGSYGGRQFYGWMNFGDTPWGGGYCQGHYDWPYSTLLSGLRGHEWPQLELARVMARHRMDIDQYHTVEDRANINGGARFEKGEHHGDMTVPPTPSHTWIHGLLLYWATTGDEFAREAAEETLTFYRGYWNRVGPPYYGLGTEARTGGWSLMGLTELYDYLHKPEALQLANKIVTAFVNYEKAEKTSGYFVNNKTYIMAWMFGIYMNGLGKYYMHTGQTDAQAGALLDRMANFFTSSQNGFGPLLGGTGSGANYAPYKMWYRWHPDPQLRKDSPRINLAHIIDGLAYGYLATGNDLYLDTAIECSGDLWRYWSLPESVKTVRQNDPADFEQITMRPTMFPNTETKILGWITNYGKVVNYATYMRETMPPLSVDVFPEGVVEGPTMLRLRVTRNRPIFLNGNRSYDGRVRANGVDSTSAVNAFFERTRTPFTETFYAPMLINPGTTLNLRTVVWDLPFWHAVNSAIRGR